MGDSLVDPGSGPTRSAKSLVAADMAVWKSVTNQYHRGRANRVYLGDLTSAEKEEISEAWSMIMERNKSKEMTYVDLVKVADTVLGKDVYSQQDLRKAMVRLDLSKNGCIDFNTFKAYMASTMSSSVDADSAIHKEEMIMVGCMQLSEMIRIYRRRITMERFMRDQYSPAVQRPGVQELQNQSVCRALSTPTLDVLVSTGSPSGPGPFHRQQAAPRQGPGGPASSKRDDLAKKSGAEAQSGAGGRVMRFMRRLFSRGRKDDQEELGAVSGPQYQPSPGDRQAPQQQQQPLSLPPIKPLPSSKAPLAASSKAGADAIRGNVTPRVSLSGPAPPACSTASVPVAYSTAVPRHVEDDDSDSDDSDSVSPFKTDEVPSLSANFRAAYHAAGEAVYPGGRSDKGRLSYGGPAGPGTGGSSASGTTEPGVRRGRVRRNSTEPVLGALLVVGPRTLAAVGSTSRGASSDLPRGPGGRPITLPSLGPEYSQSLEARSCRTSFAGSQCGSPAAAAAAAAVAAVPAYLQPGAPRPQPPAGRLLGGSLSGSAYSSDLYTSGSLEVLKPHPPLACPNSPKLGHSSPLPVIPPITSPSGNTGGGNDLTEPAIPVREGPSNFGTGRMAAPRRPNRKLVSTTST